MSLDFNKEQRAKRSIIKIVKSLNYSSDIVNEVNDILLDIEIENLRHGDTRRGLIAFILYYAHNRLGLTPKHISIARQLKFNMLQLNSQLQQWSHNLGIKIKFTVETHICDICEQFRVQESVVSDICVQWEYIQSINDNTKECIRLKNLAARSCAVAIIGFYAENNGKMITNTEGQKVRLNVNRLSHATKFTQASIKSNINIINKIVSG